MPAILTNNLSVINAENFVDSFINGESNIFMAIGRGWETPDSMPDANTTPDMVNKWDDEMNPPVPVDSITKQREFRKSILGIKKIMLNDILIMVPRVDWVPNRIFKVKSWDDKVGVRATDYYCLTSNNEVWECVHTPNDKTKGVKNEPILPDELSKLHTFTDTRTNEEYYVFKEDTTTTECYWWRYLYTIPVATANKKLLDTWMPVMFNKHGVYPGGTLTEEQYEMRGDLNANRTLGAYRVMVSCTLKDEDTIIPYDTVYRQIGLIVDPLSIKSQNNENSIQTRLAGNSYDETQFDVYSGELVYLENKRSIKREQNQEETLNLILVF
jgi:hypothetical protein